MPHNNDPHKSHKKHRNVLYSLVIILVILQIVTLTMLTIQTSKLNVKIDTEVQKASSDSKQFTNQLMDTYNDLYQENFKEIASMLTQQQDALSQQKETISQQQEAFEQEVKLLKSAQSDFSEVVEDSIKGVVTVSTAGSIGSGFIVHPSGYIVTNYHVITGEEDAIKVRTYNKKNIQAEFIGKDEARDLALLKISGQHDALELANSDELQPGKKVIAIGNPLGLSFSVTEGIVSALHRSGPTGLTEYVQTDVPLNPGSSGGPLIDTQGEVIGINNFKIGGAESLGFALESNSIRRGVNLIANDTIIQ